MSACMRQVPAITELVQIDRQGREQLKVSRLTMDVVGSGTDLSKEPAFIEAMANRVWFGPVYFRKESEPYLTMAVAHGGRGGVTVAEINLKLIWDVVSQIKVGKDGYAYVVDRAGPAGGASRHLAGAARHRHEAPAAGRRRRSPRRVPTSAESTPRTSPACSVLSAHADDPGAELAGLRRGADHRRRSNRSSMPACARLALLVLGLLIAALAGALAGAAHGGADPRAAGRRRAHRRRRARPSSCRSRPATSWNRWPTSSTARLRRCEESYATLEQRVDDRTRELTESLEQQTATAEILRVISSLADRRRTRAAGRGRRGRRPVPRRRGRRLPVQGRRLSLGRVGAYRQHLCRCRERRGLHARQRQPGRPHGAARHGRADRGCPERSANTGAATWRGWAARTR